jgi:cell shape-determining protein MreC
MRQIITMLQLLELGLKGTRKGILKTIIEYVENEADQKETLENDLTAEYNISNKLKCELLILKEENSKLRNELDDLRETMNYKADSMDSRYISSK